jgi:glycosyltransferase involved in cell wall biosynthesis
LEPALRGLAWSEPIDHWKWRFFKPLKAAILASDPDILHVQYPAQGYDGALTTLASQWFRRWLCRPVIVTLHEHISASSLLPLMMVQAANAVISVRPDFARGYQRFLSWTAALKPFHFIPNASSLPLIQPTEMEIAEIRKRLGVPVGKALVVYFGLVYPRRGVEQLFEIADPAQDHLVIVGGKAGFASDYCDRVEELARSKTWRGRVTLTGFIPDTEAAAILASADAAVLPFTGLGGGVWNTSIHAARLQGTFVLTTSTKARGYDAIQNSYWARPGDVAEMRRALRQYIGLRQPSSSDDVPQWDEIAECHRAIYARFATRREHPSV